MRARPTSFRRVVAAEAYKQVRLHWRQPLNAVLEVLFPAIGFAVAYYMFRPFTDAGATPPWLSTAQDYALQIFLITGYLGYTVFQRLLWGAMTTAFMERYSGTLEIQYLTPASRFGLALGAAVGGLLRLVYLYVAFLIGAAAFLEGWRVPDPGMLLVAALALAVPAVAWGTLANSYLLFARDANAYASLLQPPLNFFGGVRFPVTLLPGWLQAVAGVVPLSWALRVVRAVLAEGAGFGQISGELAVTMLVSGICLLLAYANVQRCERLARERGTLVLY